jgi:GNAT superfamily N-acetyltransferase
LQLAQEGNVGERVVTGEHLVHRTYHRTAVHIRPATEDDLLDLGRIFVAAADDMMRRYRPEQVGRVAMVPEDRVRFYRHLIETGAVFVADDGGPIGFSAATEREGIWFLSQFWVLPDRHGGGIGSALLDEALAWGRGARAFTVVASPHPAAQVLYLRASMYPLWTQIDVVGEGPAPEEGPPGMRELEDRDAEWRDELDREVRGGARPEDHSAFQAWGARGVVIERDGRRLGYVYGWPEGKVGPAAAHRPEELPVLIEAGRHLVGGPVTVVVPSVNWSALRELIRLGMRPIGSNTFMSSVPLGDATRYLSSGGGLG